jgi:hypothetical protein
MKINGIEFTGERTETLVIPRGGHDVVFKAKPIADMSAFEEICEPPKAKQRMLKGGNMVFDTKDPGYIAKLDEWAALKTAWLVIQSLKATEGLAWSTVDLEDPKTWCNYQDDLMNAGFTDGEIGRIIELVSLANGLSQGKIDEATERFLAGQEAAQKGQ